MSISERLRGLIPKRAPAAPDPAGVTIPAYIPAQLKALSWLATIGVFYMLWLFSVGAAADAAAALHITHAGGWVGDLQFWFPVVAAYLIIAWVVAWTGKVAVPAFVSLRWRGDELWPKVWMLVIMIAVSAVIIGGSVVVQTETRFESNREAAVAVEQVQRGRAAIEAERDAAREELNQALSNTNAYLNQAANVGAAEWERSYVAQARATNDPRLPQIERALGAARRADELRAEIRRLTAEVASAPTDASVTQRVANSEADQAMGGFVDWIGAIRAIMLAILQDIACLLLPWIAMRTEQARNRQLEAAGRAPAPETVMIEDHTADAPVTPQPMEKPREAVFDADTGEELQRITPRSYWRKKKGKPQQVQTAPEHVEDERGYEDARTAMAMSGAMPGEIELPRSEVPEHDEESDQRGSDHDAISPDGIEADHASQPTTEMSEEELAAGYAELDAQSEAPAADDAHTLPNNEGVLVDEDEVYGPPAPVRRDVMEDA